MGQDPEPDLADLGDDSRVPADAAAGLDAEAEARVARIVSAAAAAAGEERDREVRSVTDELEKLRREKRGWFQKLLLLVASLAVFYWLGGEAWGWKFVPVILVVIFIHELGHYLGMLVCGYRDVSMFFIPGLGAAVSGRQGSVPGHRRALVALSGPLPGLLLGLACTVIYGLNRSGFWLRVAQAFLLINGFNLLPFQPLDGGQMLNDVLFCRHRHIEFATTLGGGIVISLLGLVSWPFCILGVFAILGAFARLKDAGMAERLRPEVSPESLGDEEVPPPEVVARVVAEVRRGLPDAKDPRILAMRTDTVLERLRVRPPGWAASVVLVLVYGAAFLFAVASLVILAAVLYGSPEEGGGPRPQGAPVPVESPAPHRR
ncbi:MAG: zinc metalloprotease [Planctomycetota bacterium]|jgi:Zn-dependent protease